ncbi:MAG: hypothetical protein O7D94_10265, partial [Planctomycetota bacterium]|nr:hypothetical protein [Planctomycetota bacterium]
SFAMDPRQGYFTASSNVQSQVTGAALGEFLKEFEKIRGGDVSADEMTKARLTRRTNMIQSFQGLRGILAMAATLELNELPFSSIGDELNAIGDVTEDALNKLAGPSIPLDQAVIVLVGDKKTILAQIADLGLPTPTELTVTGEPAG